MKSIFAIVLLIGLSTLTPAIRADETPGPAEKPKAQAADAPRKSIAGTPVAFKIRAVKGLGETSLQIPRKVIKIVDPHDAGTDVQSRGISPAQTVVAGLALSVALGVGGVQLARRRSRSGMIVLAILTIGAGALAASHVFADRAPNNPAPAQPKAPPKDEAKGKTISTPATVQIMEQGDVVELTIDLDRAKELLAEQEKK